MPNLLVEIGVEELPEGGLDVAYEHLRPKTAELLKKIRLNFEEIKVEATPRRIALFVKNLDARQSDETLQISGPAYDKAYCDGKPTPALEGFLKSKGAKPEDVRIKETPKGKFILIEKKETGLPAKKVLPEALKGLFPSLPFSKLMMWQADKYRFPRPIRWVVALLDKAVVPFDLSGVRSSNISVGHRFLSPKPFKITGADWGLYVKRLKQAHVILSYKDREDLVRKDLLKKYDQKNPDEELVHTAAGLVEEPFLLSGNFRKEYLELPAELLASCMKKNQKIFTVYNSRGQVESKFIAVLNGKRNGLKGIQSGYENVLESRLRDARFFYQADTKETLESKLPKLEQLVYLGKLGTVKDKAERIEKLAGVIARLSGYENLSGDLMRAAKLSKIDLITHLVYEFPDLQGITGREYALESKEKEAVALAIGTQYLPKNLSEGHQELKKSVTLLGALLGIVDRLDLLVGAFATGVIPTGSQDPYALRRAGGSLVKLIRAWDLRFSIDEALESALNQYAGKLPVSVQDWKTKLLHFIRERLYFELQVKPGSREQEILKAVLDGSEAHDLADQMKRYEILVRFYQSKPDVFLKTAKVVQRAGKILQGTNLRDIPAVNPGLFQAEEEKRLYQVLTDSRDEIINAVSKKDYKKATERLGEVFYEPVHAFFEKVMVNAEDPAVRQNRQALLKAIHELYAGRVADLSGLSKLDLE